MDFDALDQLEERLENPPKLWAPKGPPADMSEDEVITATSVKGIVEEVDERTGDYGTYPVVVLVQRDKTRVQVAGFGTVLGNRLKNVSAGDAVGISYLGTRESTQPGRQPYDNYDVVIWRDNAPVSPEPSIVDHHRDEAPLPDAPPPFE